MKFTINKNILLESLINVVRAINPKNIIPILNGIKFELNSYGLNLIASDSDLTIKSFIPASDIKSIDSEGTIIIQSKYIIDIIRKLPGEEVNIEVVDSLKIRKDDVKEVGVGFECGIRLANFEKLEAGDIL